MEEPTKKMEVIRVKFQEFHNHYEQVSDDLLVKDLWKDGKFGDHKSLLKELSIITEIKDWLLGRLRDEYFKNIKRSLST